MMSDSRKLIFSISVVHLQKVESLDDQLECDIQTTAIILNSLLLERLLDLSAS
jgi:hypothetical protein